MKKISYYANDKALKTILCSKCEEKAIMIEWESAEERMKIIAQNGNDGLHYDK
jgi:uncharacterized protein YktA (UPF0223 family)